MSKTKIAGAAGRFGVRYGQHVRRRIAAIESKQRLKQICPLCGGKAKRLSKGIWKCKRCEKKFAGHAYFLEQQENKIEEGKAKVLKNENRAIEEAKGNKTTKKSKKTKTE